MHPTQGLDLNEQSPLLRNINDGSTKDDSNSLSKSPIYIYLVALVSAVGGFLFGYDTGIISGAMIYVRDHFAMSEFEQELTVSVTLMSAWLFSILSGYANNKLGRKPVILSSSIVFVLGSLTMALARNKSELIVGRFIVGIAVGLASMTVPIYIAELAPEAIRGKLVMMNIICVTCGQFIASVTALALSQIHANLAWRLMLGLAAVPAFLQFLALLAMPESPRWLVSMDRFDEAKSVLAQVRPQGYDIESEFEQIKSSQENDKNQTQSLSEHESNDTSLSTTTRILRSGPVRKALIVGCLLQLAQQLTGINTVMYYAASIFQMAGIYSKSKALLMASIAAFVNFTFTLVGFFLVERVGRRPLTLFSLAGVAISLLVLGASFHIAYNDSPPANYSTSKGSETVCSTYTRCSSCTRDSNCGYCFKKDSHDNYRTSACLRSDQANMNGSLTGPCSNENNMDKFVWAYEWCPSSYWQYTLIGMIVYLVFFAPGMGPMPWTINSEIYPSWARSWCQSAATSVNWLGNLMVSITFLSLTRLMKKHGAFYLYGGCSFVGLVFFSVMLPETKGCSLENVESLFESTTSCKSKKKDNQVENDSKTNI